jgi:asparagine synthase (glutamine-hydrolysing)
MISDVPLGAFLSGGIDSSTIVALMQKNSDSRIRTFSIGFREDEYNEAGYARRIAQHLGTEHTEFYVSPDDALDVIPCLPDIFDEPFADSSQIPTYLVSKLTRKHVTVALSGDGGDEVFAGYNRYLYADKVMPWLNFLPGCVNSLLVKIINSLPPDQWSNATRYLPRHLKIPALGDKLYKLADILGQDGAMAYHKLVSHWHRPEDIVVRSKEPKNLLLNQGYISGINSVIDQMQLLDTVTYLPDDILTKVDRTTMAVSLEGRTPFLDHRLVEHAWRLPLDMKVRNGQGKWVLRQILYQYVPRDLVERPKTGFAVPIGNWLRGTLRDWAESLLDSRKIINQGYLNYPTIKQKWDEHISGEKNWQYHLWDVLMFQSWLERWMT